MSSHARELDRLGRRIRHLLLARRVSTGLAALVVVLVVMVLADWWWRPGAPVRLMELLLVCAGTILWWVRVIVPAWHVKVSRVDLALRMERKLPQARHKLASAVELQHEHPNLASQLTSGVDHNTLRSQLNSTHTRRAVGVCALVLLAVAVLIGINPDQAWTGLRRIVTPTSSVTWPPRAVIASRMGVIAPQGVHGRPMPLVLSALNRTVAAPDGPVDAHWRTDGSAQWQTIRLTNQGNRIHERIIEPDGDQVEIRFSSEDCLTPIETIAIVDLPEVESMVVTVTPPPWAHGVRDTQQMHGPPQAVLEGSEVSVSLTSNRPLVNDDTVTLSPDRPYGVTTDNRVQTIEWTAHEQSRLAVRCVDQWGLESLRPFILDVPVVEDMPPDVVLEHPAQDEDVLSHARVALEAHAEDDVMLDTMSIHSQVDGSSSAPRVHVHTPGAKTGSITDVLDLSEFELDHGDIVTIHARASDARGRDRAEAHSTPRMLHVVDRDTFVDALRRDMASMADDAKALDERQLDLMSDETLSGRQQRDQVALARDLDGIERSITRSVTRMDFNGLDDPSMRLVLTQAGEASKRGAQAAREAADARDQQVGSFQQGVHQELTTVIDLLGRDEDLWLARAGLNDLLSRQERLRGESERFARDMPGLDRDTASEDMQAIMDDLATRQESLATDLQAHLDDMAASAHDASREVATGLNAALESAAKRTPVLDMQRASEASREGRMYSASLDQQAAVEALREMIEHINEQPEEQSQQLERLRRHIESLLAIASELVDRAQALGIRLNQADATTGFDVLSLDTLALRRTALGAVERARSGGPDLSQVTDMLQDASAALSDTAAHLRANPSRPIQARESLTTATSRLTSVVELLRRMQEATTRRELEELRHKIRSAYLELASAQDALRIDVEALLIQERDRRRRFDARKAGRTQVDLGDGVQTVLDDHEIISNSTVFVAVHEHITRASTRAHERLLNGGVDEMVILNQRSVSDSLAMLAEALGNDSGDDPPFEQGAAAGGSSGGSGADESAALPSIAELKLLRSMQAALLEETRQAQDDPVEIDEIGRRQRELSTMTEALFERERARSEGVQIEKAPEPGPPAIGWNRSRVDDAPPARIDPPLPTLDALLGLEEHADVSDELPAPTPRDPMDALIHEMTMAADLLEEAHDAGLDTQRFQHQALERLETLIERARRSQSSPSQQASGGDSSEAQSDGDSPQSPGASTQAQGEAAPSSTGGQGGDGVRASVDARLSGSLEEHRSQWGSLPPRIRARLDQGRRDAYASLYERMTGEYFRRLAEDRAP